MKKKFLRRCLSCVLSLVCIFSSSIRIHAAANASYSPANQYPASNIACKVQVDDLQMAVEKECNNSLRTANELTSSYIYGKIESIFDVDCYKTQFYKEQDVVISLDEIPESKDYNIFVYDDNKKLVCTSKNQDSIESVTLKNVQMNQWYYIKIKGCNFSYSKRQNYRLLVSEQQDNANTKLKLGIDGEIIVPVYEQEQMFEFTPEKTASYFITVQGCNNMECMLYDETKENIVMKGRTVWDTQKKEIACTLLEKNTYYIGVQLAESSEISEVMLTLKELNTPDDEYFNKQWGLLNSVNGIDMNVLPSWKYVSDNPINIAIVDTGVDYHHDDLKNGLNMELAYNFVHDSNDIYPETESDSLVSARKGHGTHIAGIIAAESNNRIGVAGIAPKQQLIPLKVLGSKLTDSTVYAGSVAAFVKAVEYAQSNDVKILNCSFGGDALSRLEKKAILKASDILFIIAAGNSSNDLAKSPEYPACYNCENALVVSAVNQEGQIAEYSNYGGPAEIAAPGDMIYGTAPSNSYIQESGTSMAAAAVTAVASMVWRNHLSLSPVEIKNILVHEDNVTKLVSLRDKVSSSGLVNAFKAVTSDATPSSQDTIEPAIKDVKAMVKAKPEISTLSMSNQVIIELKNDENFNTFLQRTIHDKSEELADFTLIDVLNSVNAYVIQFNSIEEAESAVKIINSTGMANYAEINYLREEY